jgi:ABC-type polysaccharide/polyol phosphate export permease
VRLEPRRLRPAELLAALGAVALALALFLPWYAFPRGREDAWQALTVTEIPAAAAALVALALFVATLNQRSPALPVALAVWTTVLGVISLGVVGVRALALPAMALGRCYGLWMALAASLVVACAGWLAMRDERPFWGVAASGLPLR